MSYDESKASDVFFMVDGSRSMNDRMKSSGKSKMAMAKEGLLGFISERWPVSYFPWPVRMGVAFYRLLGTPGDISIDVVVPLNPPPASLELYRLKDQPCKGGSPLAEAVNYSIAQVRDSIRPWRRVKLISDGGNDLEPVKDSEDRLKGSGIPVDAIELSNSASQELRYVATATGGKYYRANSLAEFLHALSVEILPSATS